MRRKAGALVPLELSILESVLALQSDGEQAYGFKLAKHIAGASGNATLTSHGTLYKALARMAERGLVDSAWEDPADAESDGRPRRRTYTVTAEGEVAIARERARLTAAVTGIGAVSPA